MGLYFEEFNVGEEFISPGRTITEADVCLFAGLSGDYNPLHTDEEYAKKNTVFGTRIVHGMLGLSILTGLIGRIGVSEGTAIAFLGFDDWKFTGPILFGDTVHLKMTITGKRETSKPDRGVIVRQLELINQKNEVVQKGISNLMVKRRT